jgi:hypothetical protein
LLRGFDPVTRQDDHRNLAHPKITTPQTSVPITPPELRNDFARRPDGGAGSGAAIAAFTVGVCIDLYRPAVSTATADLVAPERRVIAYRMLFWAIDIGFSVATISAGLAARHGFTTLFWIDALLALTALGERIHSILSRAPGGCHRRAGAGCRARP